MYLELINRLEKITNKKIKDYGNNVSRRFKPIKGEYFNYIEISEVDLNNGVFNEAKILGEAAPDRAQKIVQENDVIISTVRPNRNAVSLIRKEQENFVASSGFCVIEPKKVSPEYLFVYLKTNHVIKLLDRLTSASLYPAVNEEDIMELLFFIKNEKEIIKQVQNCFDHIDKSKFLYSQAENLLLEELGFKASADGSTKLTMTASADLTYITTLKDCQQVNRFDAEYFHLKFERILDVIKKYKDGYDNILNFVKNIDSKFDPLKYPEGEFQYIELANIDSSSGIITGSNLILGKEAPSRARLKLQKDDVIFSSVAGSLDKVALVTGDYNDALASTGFFLFRPTNILPQCFLVLAKSIVMQSQLEKEASGAILSAVNKDSLSRIMLPKLPQKIQQKIADLVNESFKLRKKAKDLLEEAKRKIEEEIEKK